MRFRRIAAATALSALAVAVLPMAPASAVAAPDGPVVAIHTSAAKTAAAAARYAPAVPGAARFRWSLPADVRQVIVVTASTWTTTYGTVSLYSRTSTGWRRDALWGARLGWSGMVIGSRRVQDSGKTPAGVYRITQTFGRLANPGTREPYTRVTSDHWWVEDRRSAYYNQMRRGSLGGFALRTSGYNSSEHLVAMGAQYDYVAVIDFNRPNPVIGRGAGIFLHAFGSGATAGCVSIRHDRMATALRWLNPAANPRIILGEDGWLAGS